MWEGFPPMAVPSRETYLVKLKECDIYIGLFGNEYGVPEEDGLSPTERMDLQISLNLIRAN